MAVRVISETSRYRPVGAVSLFVIIVGVLAVIVAQWDPGHFVVVQQLRGAAKLSVAVTALPLLVSALAAVFASKERLPRVAVAGLLVTLLVAGVMFVGCR